MKEKTCQVSHYTFIHAVWSVFNFRLTFRTKDEPEWNLLINIYTSLCYTKLCHSFFSFLRKSWFLRNVSPSRPSSCCCWRSVECPWKECWRTGGEPLHVFGVRSLSVTMEPPIFTPPLPCPLSLGMSAFWGTTCWPPRERTQGRRARRDRCINKITLVFHLGEAGCPLLFSSMQM